MNIAVLITILLIALFGYAGMKRGLIKTVFSVFSLLVTVLLTAFISPYLSEALQDNQTIYDFIYEKVESNISLENDREAEAAEDAENSEDEDDIRLPELLNGKLVKDTGGMLQEAIENTASDARAYIYSNITKLIINVISFVAVFITVFVLLKIICAILDLVSRLPVLNGINKLFGLAVGLIEGYFIVCLIGLAVTVFAATAWGHGIFEMIEESRVLSYIYENNLILVIVRGVGKQTV